MNGNHAQLFALVPERGSVIISTGGIISVPETGQYRIELAHFADEVDGGAKSKRQNKTTNYGGGPFGQLDRNTTLQKGKKDRKSEDGGDYDSDVYDGGYDPESRIPNRYNSQSDQASRSRWFKDDYYDNAGEARKKPQTPTYRDEYDGGYSRNKKHYGGSLDLEEKIKQEMRSFLPDDECEAGEPDIISSSIESILKKYNEKWT